MPIYEYKCPKCNNLFQLLERMSEATEIRKCPKCGEGARKIVSLSSFHLKGSGWYVTDYKGKSSGNGENKEAACKSADGNSPQCACCPTNK
jgi:putative FmdB family regulatory protein